jgi:protein-S-isoprenylcysteine O-methyltransferase Ste14
MSEREKNMNTDSSTMHQTDRKVSAFSMMLRRIGQVFGNLALIGIILFAASGRLDWVWAWVYIGAGVVTLIINAIILLPRRPDLVAERAEIKGNAKLWDYLLTRILLVVGLAVFLVAGLDERFGWTPPYSAAIRIGALIVIMLAQLLFVWAMVSNKFFSKVVRIQIERGHHVESGGPYRYIRHPGYLANIISMLAVALLLGSLWALIPAGVSGVLFVVRTGLEDRTLRAELEGYKEYARQTRYRLIPGVW